MAQRRDVVQAAIAVFVVAAAAAQADAGPVLLNGSFESSGYSGAGPTFHVLGGGNPGITSWSIGGVGVDYFKGDASFPASDGIYWVDLCRGPGDFSTLSQTVSGFVLGTSYTLTFDVQQHLLVSGTRVFATLGGSTGSFLGSAPDVWTTVSLSWVATTTSALVRFQDASGGTSVDQDVFLDNVRLAETAAGVPLPTGAAQGAAVGGLSLAWLAWRRRRSARTA